MFSLASISREHWFLGSAKFLEEYCDATEDDNASVFKREMKELLYIEKGLEELRWDR